MKYAKKHLILLALTVSGFAGILQLGFPAVVAAETCAGVKTSILKCSPSEQEPVIAIIMQIVNFLAIGVGIAVVGGIVYGAIIYTTSNGEPAKTKQAVTIIVNAVIGLVLFIFAYAIINFLVPGGAF